MDSDIFDVILPISQITKHIDGSTDSRSFKQAEEILKCKNLVSCGIKKVVGKRIEILALCVQTCGISKFPHKIEGQITVDPVILIDKIACTCKGGAAGTCKHCVAVLLYINRNSLKDLKIFSSTDIKCIWAEKKAETDCWYSTVPIRDFCCVPTLSCHQTLTEKEKEAKRKKVMELFPSSAFAKHMNRKRTELPEQSEPCSSAHLTLDVNVIINNMLDKPQPDFPQPDLEPHCLDFYTKNVIIEKKQALTLALAAQNTSSWMEARKYRITASRAYELYTYNKNKKPDWTKKCTSWMKNMYFSNSSTNYGILAEDDAARAFESVTKKRLFSVGLIINPRLPWLGCSPDRLQINGEEIVVVEIKCPTNGMNLRALEMVANLNYIQSNKDGCFTLKHNHKYYGQVQLQLYLTGCNKCMFVIYASYDKSFVSLEVLRDEKFIKLFISSLHDVYFTKMLPFLASNPHL